MADFRALCGLLLFVYGIFLFGLYARVRRSLRPVPLWLRKLPAWIFLAISGFVFSIPFFDIWIQTSKPSHPAPSTFVHTAFIVYITGVALWGALSLWITHRLFQPGGALNDEVIKHRNGIVQRIARNALGIVYSG